jgi:hypothetical protein
MCCSCATILNNKNTLITIGTDREASVIINSDTLHTKQKSVAAAVMRSKQPLEIDIVADSLHKHYSVKSQNSLAFWANIDSYCIGMLADWNNPKRYGYPKEIYLDLHDSSNKYHRFIPSSPGKFYLLISMPHANNFLVRPGNNEGTRTNTGFFGLSVGLDYYYKKNKFLRLSAGAVTNFPIPFPAPYDYKGDVVSISSQYVNISNNYQLNRFLLGYGISISRNYWHHYNDYTNPVVEYGSQTNTAAGIVLQSYYKLGRTFYIGAIYRPTFFRFSSSNPFEYEHLISIDLLWRLRL